MNTMLIFLLASAALIMLWAVLAYNRLVRSRIRVDEAWSSVDVQLKRRANLVPNLVQTVSGYASHERETLENVTRARQQVQQAGDQANVQQANQLLEKALGRLLVVVEQYPQLQAAEGFLALQRELSDLEEKIAYARQFYNRCVLEYNAQTRTLPSSIIASLGGFTRRSFFETEEPPELPKVDFNTRRPQA